MLSNQALTIPSNISTLFLKTYLKSGDLQSARQLFDKIPQPDLRSLALLISAYTDHGRPREAISIYSKLQSEKNLKPDGFVLLSLAKACAASEDLVKAMEIHRDVIRFGFSLDLPLANCLIDMYGKCGCVEGSRKVFDEMLDKDVVSWTTVISSYLNCGMTSSALGLLNDMVFAGAKPNSVTLSTVLPACSELRALNHGREIHCFAMRKGLDDNVFVSSGLVDMYAKCSSVRKARIIFDRILQKDVVSWNVILAAYFLSGEYQEGMNLFKQMKDEGLRVNSSSWNCMISGCVNTRNFKLAFEVLSQMQHFGLKCSKVTLASLLPAFTSPESLMFGRESHAYIVRHGFEKDVMLSTAILLMYAKCGELENSRKVFNAMTTKDTVTWNTMILANSIHGCGDEVLLLFKRMIQLHVRPTTVTFMVVLSGCSHSHLVDESREIFDSMSRDYGIEPDANHYACIVDVLSRSGYLKEAYEFIQSMPMQPTVGVWGALLSGCREYKNVEFGRIAAEKLFEIEPENSGNYILLSNIFVSMRMWENVSKIGMLMKEKRMSKVAGCSWIQI
ncbi:TPR-like protein [Dioscorea alata]|uniref:TPR-like protein n=1 Tax=Dioscorea alata TaxID=55571 RepID=A0ACB7VHS5_DIOAL|nr:TPR-like protein [Dioscorea alata]